MNKLTIGILFITAGLLYGSLIADTVYERTLGYLVRNDWITPPAEEKTAKTLLGRKPTILLYSLALIVIGIFLIWNRNE